MPTRLGTTTSPLGVTMGTRSRMTVPSPVSATRPSMDGVPLAVRVRVHASLLCNLDYVVNQNFVSTKLETMVLASHKGACSAQVKLIKQSIKLGLDIINSVTNS